MEAGPDIWKEEKCKQHRDREEGNREGDVGYVFRRLVLGFAGRSEDSGEHEWRQPEATCRRREQPDQRRKAQDQTDPKEYFLASHFLEMLSIHLRPNGPTTKENERAYKHAFKPSLRPLRVTTRSAPASSKAELRRIVVGRQPLARQDSARLARNARISGSSAKMWSVRWKTSASRECSSETFRSRTSPIKATSFHGESARSTRVTACSFAFCQRTIGNVTRSAGVVPSHHPPTDTTALISS